MEEDGQAESLALARGAACVLSVPSLDKGQEVKSGRLWLEHGSPGHGAHDTLSKNRKENTVPPCGP